MPLTDLDKRWFQNRPARQYRLRRQTPAELLRWPVPPHDGLVGWCVIRRDDGAMELFALAAGDAWDDHDADLSLLFSDLRTDAA